MIKKQINNQRLLTKFTVTLTTKISVGKNLQETYKIDIWGLEQWDISFWKYSLFNDITLFELSLSPMNCPQCNFCNVTSNFFSRFQHFSLNADLSHHCNQQGSNTLKNNLVTMNHQPLQRFSYNHEAKMALNGLSLKFLKIQFKFKLSIVFSL